MTEKAEEEDTPQIEDTPQEDPTDEPIVDTDNGQEADAADEQQEAE